MIAGKTETKNQPNAGTLVAVKKIVPFGRESYSSITWERRNHKYLICETQNISGELRNKVEDIICTPSERTILVCRRSLLFLHPTPDRRTKSATRNCTNIPTMTVCQFIA